MANMCPNWSYVSNHSEDESGRVIVIWKAPLTVVTLHKSRQSVTCMDRRINDSTPRIIGGDFNETIHPCEHSDPT
ncbi:hypothetical protein AALP_AAs43842U000100, partial [Arabis alpina]